MNHVKLEPLGVEEIPTRRVVMDEMVYVMSKAGGVPTEGLRVSERTIKVPSGTISIRIYTPDGEKDETFPVFVDIHGGGWVFGNLNTDDVSCRKLCITHRLSVVNVGYRLAPEHPWPTGINDSYAALKWTVNNLLELKGDLSKGFLLGGASAGANYVCLLTQRARCDPELKGKITGQVLQVPHTCWSDSQGVLPEKFAKELVSREENKDDPLISPELLITFFEAYKPASIEDPEASPLMAESFEELPTAYIQVAGADIMRDDGILYEKKLREGSVKTKIDVYPGVSHGFANFAPLIKASVKWQEDFERGIRWLLGREG